MRRILWFLSQSLVIACHICKRYSKGNKKCDPKTPRYIKHSTTTIHNVHGVSKFLSTDEFKLLCPSKISFEKYDENSLQPFILHVNLEYPKELQKLDKDYLLASDKLEIKEERFSDCQLKTADYYNSSIGNVGKLVLNFFNKEEYELHFKNLKIYLMLRLKKKTLSILMSSIKFAKSINLIQYTQK